MAAGTQGVIINFANSAEKNLFWCLFLIKLEFWGPATSLKNTPILVFSYEICKFFKNHYFEEHLWTSASKHYLKETRTQGRPCKYCKLFKNTYFLEHLQTACSQTPVTVSFVNNVRNLTAWRLLIVLERDCRTGISQWILRNF